MSDKPILKRGGLLVGLAIVGVVLSILVAFLAGAVVGRYAASRAVPASQARSATMAIVAYLTAQPTSTSTLTPTITAIPTATPDASATAAYRVQEVAEAVSSTLAAQPTNTALPTATTTPLPTVTSLPTSTPTRTVTPNADATQLAYDRAVRDAAAATLAALPTNTATLIPTVTPVPDLDATEAARLRVLAAAVAETLTAVPADTPTSTPTATSTPDLGATRRAYLRDLSLAVAAALTAAPTDTPSVTLTSTPRPDLKATELARRREIAGAIAMTLTAQPAPICTPLLVRPTLTLWGGVVVSPEDKPLVVPTDTPTTGCSDDAGFVTDVTVPDGASIDPGVSFDKTWRVNNSGTCPWGPDYQLQFVSGDRLGDASSVPLPVVLPGGTADISVPLVAPLKPGTYRGVWQLGNATGKPFGQNLVVSIQVPRALQPMSSISFRADPPYVNGGACTTLHWDARGARDVYLDGQPVAKQSQQQVCPCQRTTYVLRVVGQDGQVEERALLVDVYGTCATTAPPLPDEKIEFWADASYVRAGACTTLHWDVEGVLEVHLDGDGVIGTGSRKVCPCERETYVLSITRRNGQTEERSLSVDVAGECETAVETEVDFRVSDTSLRAGECTSLIWRVSGAKSVFLDDEPVDGQGKQEVCPCESTTYTLTAVYPDDSSRDFQAHVKVSGTCQTFTPSGPVQLLEPLIPSVPLFILPTPAFETLR